MLAPDAVAKVALFESDRMLLDDFNALAEGLRALGISSVFLDIESIFRDGELLLSRIRRTTHKSVERDARFNYHFQ